MKVLWKTTPRFLADFAWLVLASKRSIGNIEGYLLRYRSFPIQRNPVLSGFSFSFITHYSTACCILVTNITQLNLAPTSNTFLRLNCCSHATNSPLCMQNCTECFGCKYVNGCSWILFGEIFIFKYFLHHIENEAGNFYINKLGWKNRGGVFIHHNTNLPWPSLHAAPLWQNFFQLNAVIPEVLSLFSRWCS